VVTTVPLGGNSHTKVVAIHQGWLLKRVRCLPPRARARDPRR